MAEQTSTRRRLAGFCTGCVVLGLVAACSSSPLPDMPEYAPAQPFIEEYQRVQQRKQIYQDYAERQRALAVQRANAKNWEGWLRVNRSRDLGLDEQAYKANAERVYSVTNREFMLREWNIHKNRQRYGEALAAQRQAAIARAEVRDRSQERADFLAMQQRIKQQRSLEAWREEQRARALAMRAAESQRVFEQNREIFEARRQPVVPPPTNNQGQRIAPSDPQERAQYAAALARLDRLRREQRLLVPKDDPQRLQQEAMDRAAFADLQQRIAEGLARRRAADSELNRQRALAAFQRQQALGLAPAPAEAAGGGAPAAAPTQQTPAQQAPAVINVVPPVQQQAGP